VFGTASTRCPGTGFGGVRQSVLYTRSAFDEEYMDEERFKDWRLCLYGMGSELPKSVVRFNKDTSTCLAALKFC
jgi:hypothetical protein